MLLPLAPGTQSHREKLATVVDSLNRRYGARVLTYGDQQERPGFFEKG